MNENTAAALVVPAATCQDVLTEILRDGAQRLLGQAIEVEVESWIESHKHLVDDDGHRQVVGNGRLPTRTILTGVGPVQVTRRRVHDRRIVGENDDGQPIDGSGRPIERFGSKILPSRRISVKTSWQVAAGTASAAAVFSFIRRTPFCHRGIRYR